MSIRAALLDERGIFVGVDELDEADLTGRHLAGITECDLPIGKYKWIPDDKNPMGGAFWPVAYLQLKGIEV